MTRLLPIVLASLLVASATAGVASATEAERDYIVVSTSGESVTGDLARAEVVAEADSIGAAVASLTPREAQALAADPSLVVSPDGPMGLVPTVPDEAAAGKAPLPAEEVLSGRVEPARTAESWGIDRVDQRTGTDGTYLTRPEISGAGVHVYVLDTGLTTSHPEFAGRVGAGADFVGDGYGVQDCDGHGTHVAGTIASTKYGVADGAIVHPVRVLGCSGSGTWAAYIAALDWIATMAPANSVANASLGGSYNAAVNQASDNLVARGVPLVVAAGNSGQPIRLYSPASASNVITVMATDPDDGESAYTNYGPEADIFAPGTDIWSTYYLDPAYKMRLSGTSMAAPHVAGYAALRLQTAPTESPAATKAALLSHSTKDVVDPYFPGQYTDDLVYTYAVAKSMRVAASAVSNQTALRVDVDPSVGADSWTVQVQKRSGSRWATVRTVRTVGTTEVVTVALPRGTYRAVVPAGQHGYTAATASATVTLTPLRVTASAVSNRSKMRVDVDPNIGSASWKVQIQKKQGSRWPTVRTVRTQGPAEIVTVDLPRGTYRAVVPKGQRGFTVAATSRAVSLLR